MRRDPGQGRHAFGVGDDYGCRSDWSQRLGLTSALVSKFLVRKPIAFSEPSPSLAQSEGCVPSPGATRVGAAVGAAQRPPGSRTEVHPILFLVPKIKQRCLRQNPREQDMKEGTHTATAPQGHSSARKALKKSRTSVGKGVFTHERHTQYPTVHQS
ncbi:hypothetical protein NDU88_007167 [Pleurodeles waltl]|uniref:Uncharacterized protein n=1 Tax=Pleurodeles waltl TaxID=8319 RepID=A0AAV7LWY6_PLEWA|nr:hypothetical protein NDU88_007167 [Pleurodeles waltl]